MINDKADRIQNAINHIKSSVDIDPWAMEIAVEAMEKQIPQKPIRINKNWEFDGNWSMICPTCKRTLLKRITTAEESYPIFYNKTGHCWCGQAIDWGVE
jgi:hypothetical protein